MVASYTSSISYHWVCESGPSTEEVFEKLTGGDFEWLRENDQLNMERSLGNVFQGFREGFEGVTPPFEPTYKFQVPFVSMFFTVA